MKSLIDAAFLPFDAISIAMAATYPACRLTPQGLTKSIKNWARSSTFWSFPRVNLSMISTQPYASWSIS